jgi:hemerythrin-like domain-containing protein
MIEDMADEAAKKRIQKEIDENLKRVYQDALKEEIPERFKLLLEQLKAKGGQK